MFERFTTIIHLYYRAGGAFGCIQNEARVTFADDNKRPGFPTVSMVKFAAVLAKRRVWINDLAHA
ncbi:MAG: hypothetical protein GXP29_07780 [Planctomycetes bacterium]|nr:hypothetical protein [Planctomycetota bacterium]